MRYTASMRCTDARRGGVVIVMTLIAIVLLAGMLFYVMNMGRATTARVTTQHSADAAAAAASGWVARSMNTVAMNNVEIARYIALINVLDSLPLAIDMTVSDPNDPELSDLEALRQAVEAQLRHGVSDLWFRQALQGMMLEMGEDNVDLQELDNIFRNDPNLVINMTHYAPGDGRGPGQIWRAMMALDDISMSTMENLRAMAQLNAMAGGMANLSGQNVQNARVLAVVADLPWQRGSFHDFEAPVRQGLLPEHVDDKQYNRGPFDTLFGWRYTDGRDADSGYIGGPGSTPLSQSIDAVEPTTYRTYGTQAWMVNQIPNQPYERLRYWVGRLSNIKRGYVWPGTGPRTIIKPIWEIDIARDGERAQRSTGRHAWDYAENDRSDIRETLYIVCEMKSRVANNPGAPGMQGVTWNYVQRPGYGVPFLYHRSGWHDARNGPPFQVQSTTPVAWRKVNDHIWRLSATYATNPDDWTLGGDPSIGLMPQQTGVDDDGNPIYAAQEVYWEIDFMLVGVNVGEPVDVRNPYAGFDPHGFDAPAPIDLNHTIIGYDREEAHQQYLSVLAIARQADRSLFWPSRFDAGKPFPHTVAIAQARVFNNHSWDMWTQMWHAQLEPVSHYREWVNALASFPADGYPPPEEAEEMRRYLSSLENLADLLLTH